MRAPNAADGAAIHQLIQRCPPLDTNSVYCNLLQCTHFADTSVAAEIRGEIVGFISGYLVPARPNTLFIWQVAVSDRCRGQGLAGRMLAFILQQQACTNVDMLETTVTPSNLPSKALFQRLATKLDAHLESAVIFDREQHFAGAHDSECLLRIGPFS